MADAAGPVVRSVEFYNIELALLADGRVYVSMTPTMVDDEEPQLITQEIAHDTSEARSGKRSRFVRGGRIAAPTRLVKSQIASLSTRKLLCDL
jgi:hypothetical protein